MRLSNDVYFAVDAAKRRERSRLGRRLHAWQRAQPLEQLPVKLLFLGGGRGFAFLEREGRIQNVLRVKVKLHLLKLDETAHQQPRAREQDQRQRHYKPPQSVAQPAPPETAASAFASVFQRLDQILSDHLQRGRQAEER